MRTIGICMGSANIDVTELNDDKITGTYKVTHEGDVKKIFKPAGQGS